ncbi:MAG: HEAT repeat domain-containing protein [Gemmatimonadetes bacterium]|nr:HEAT repeat domain-containing protein [Gemmatimonadota bacterium]
MFTFETDIRTQENLDLSENLGFTSRLSSVPSFDSRSDAELREVARSHPDPVERERALWEYGYRRKAEALPFLDDALRFEERPSVRWNLLWLGLKVGQEAAVPMMEAALADDDREVRDWARVFLRDAAGAELETEYTHAVYTPDGPFDQTLPLQIAGFALVNLPGLGPVRATLSPLWFERIMGRVLACTNQDTFMKDLTIEKLLEGYHPDGTDHYEIFPFSGISWRTSDEHTQHRYECFTTRRIYRSGRVEDDSEGVIEGVPIILNRAAETSGVAINSFTLTSLPGVGSSSREIFSPARKSLVGLPITDPRGIKLLNGRVVRTVSGQFFGWGHTSVQSYARSGTVLPGTVQLVNPLHEATAGLVNTYLCGTFRGKLGDQDGDGVLDVNTVPCHGTPDGRLDYRADGSFAPDPFA